MKREVKESSDKYKAKPFKGHKQTINFTAKKEDTMEKWRKNIPSAHDARANKEERI